MMGFELTAFLIVMTCVAVMFFIGIGVIIGGIKSNIVVKGTDKGEQLCTNCNGNNVCRRGGCRCSDNGFDTDALVSGLYSIRLISGLSRYEREILDEAVERITSLEGED